MVITVNAQNSFKKKRRKRSPFDANFVRSLEYMKDSDQIVDEFYSFWEYLNDVSRVAEKRLMIALMAQLTAIFWHPIVCTGLSSPCADMAASVTAYTTEMIRSLTDQRLLRVFLVVLIGEEGGAGKDVEPERKVDHIILDLIDDEHDGESTHTGDNGTDTTNRSQMTLSTENEYDMDMTLRLLLINRMDSECHDLALATLRLFDTIIDTYNQFAIYNLVLRNYLDISPNGEHITDIPRRRSSVNEGLHSLSLDSEKSNDTESEKSLEDPPEGKKLATNADEKTQKVQWLIERYYLIRKIALSRA